MAQQVEDAAPGPSPALCTATSPVPPVHRKKISTLLLIYGYSTVILRLFYGYSTVALRLLYGYSAVITHLLYGYSSLSQPFLLLLVFPSLVYLHLTLIEHLPYILDHEGPPVDGGGSLQPPSHRVLLKPLHLRQSSVTMVQG